MTEAIALAIALETARIINEKYHLDITEADVVDIVATVPMPLELEVTLEEDEAFNEMAARLP